MAEELNQEVVSTEPEAISSVIVASQPMEMRQTGMRTDIPPGTVDYAPDAATVQADIDRLKQVKEKAEEDARYWRKQKAEARAEYFKSRGEPPPPPPATPVEDLGIGPEPRQDDFDDYQKYLDSKIKYEVTKAKASWEKDEARKRADNAYNERMGTLRMRIDEGYKKYEDFEEVAMDRTVPITPMIMDILAETENPHDIAYYLGKNRIEAIQISKMTPIQATKAISKIEAEIAKAGANPPSGKKTVTNAPPPIKPLGGAHTVEKDPEKMTQKEYEAWAKQNPGLRRF